MSETFKRRTVLAINTKQGEWALEVRDGCIFVTAKFIDLDELPQVVNAFQDAMREGQRLLEAEEAKRVD